MTATMTVSCASLLPLASNLDWMHRASVLATEADARRARAAYNTGSILVTEAAILGALSEHLQARVIIEVGTFIGTSTMALAMGSAVQTIYTCDSSNDCLPSTDVIKTYPKTSSVDMLQDLRRLGVRADLCFFDGVLRDLDLALLKGLTHAQTVFAFHDYNYGTKIRANGVQETVPRKGIGNVNLLRPWLSKHTMMEPWPGTTLALLLPEARL